MPKAWFICDRSGFRFPYEQRIIESTGFVVGPTESDGAYDLKSHPQNKSPRVEERHFIRDARPEGDGGINLQWHQATTQWNNNLKYWNLI